MPREVVCLLVLWSGASFAALGAVAYWLFGDPKFGPTAEEVRADGERVVAELEAYKTAHGRYPASLEEAGISREQPHSKVLYCYPYLGSPAFKGLSDQSKKREFYLRVECGRQSWRYYQGWGWQHDYQGGGG
jgi:hypothetical protein